MAAPEANESTSVNETNASTSVNVNASPEVRVCRRASCPNSVADCCRTGFCSRHCDCGGCKLFHWLLFDPLSQPSVHVSWCDPRSACTGYLPDSSKILSALRMSAILVSAFPIAAVMRAVACANSATSTARPDCWVLVAPECTIGFCRQHCTSTRCSCAHARSSSPAPPRHVPERSRCRRRGCQAFVAPGCRSSRIRVGVHVENAISRVAQSWSTVEPPKDQDSDNQGAHITNVFGCGRRHDNAQEHEQSCTRKPASQAPMLVGPSYEYGWPVGRHAPSGPRDS